MSASRFASLTGVSRERLRTWERRHGFPVPHRVAHGPRRYAVADVPRVVAVRRGIEQGVPIPRAIADANGPPAVAGAVSAVTFRAAAEHAPVPLAIVSGPRPLRVEYVNGALQAARTAPRVGDDLHRATPWLAGSETERALDALFTSGAAAATCEHPSWTGSGRIMRSRLHRLPVEPGAPPMVVLVGASRAGEDRADELALENRRLARQAERQARWLATVAAVAELFQRDTGDELLRGVADTLVARLGAVDAAVALYMGGELATGPSSSGLLGARMVTVAAYAELGAVLRDGAPRRLGPAAAAAFGAPTELHTVVVPVLVVAETLGALLLVFHEPAELTEEVRQLLAAVSASVGFTVLRDRLVERSARAPA